MTNEPIPSQLIFKRGGSNPPVRNFCMYCGRPSDFSYERKITNPRRDPVQTNDDRTRNSNRDSESSGGLEVTIAAALVSLVAVLRKQSVPNPDPPLVPDHTIVTITKCSRHHWYWPIALSNFVWPLILVFASLGISWLLAQAIGNDPSLLGSLPAMVRIFGLLGSIALLIWKFSVRPWLSKSVMRDSVTLSGICPLYFSQKANAI